ncbi:MULTISPECIES: F0F1 ATP synthase subunit B [unclassified Kaistella]|uniref:F0F1 ATP synthase subunit B n=1 Tax=unclassified Kaistella TaxID=2762626 RepID=UPI002732CACE|nr:MULTISPECIES: F0F1 ATP synthase subunit B [unclassified Kaistella]MCZ2084028.1 F0F1 ATP synthase subunit B [Flavobacteriales bacterium]MDP2454797.1 F0F1 ATP synthase subunit B [Kaistella sp. SH11-4b]MDP2457534.1 F0F1 ATP synthase subunit B [Kaistella sp. SH40-3]MDP2460294.1 F0F1 ATP synthase subunit B [Kaistella sp. SH19-2b]
MIEPGIGLLFWMTLTFLILLFLLAKFAWKPIMAAINEREVTIVDSLNQAKLAKQEVENLKAENEIIIREAKIQRDQILKEARDIKDRIVGEAKGLAQAEGDKMIAAARQTIQAERSAAVADIKSQIGALSVNIAESILKQKLDNNDAQDALVANILNSSNLN